MSIGGIVDTEVYSESSAQDLTKHLTRRQRRGTWIALVAQTSERALMAKTQIPSVLQPWDAHNLYSALEDELRYQAVIQGIDLEEAKVTTIVQLFPESGKIDFEKESYTPNYQTKFKKTKYVIEVQLGNPTSTLFF